MALEVADHAVHAQARVLLGERLRAVAHHALGHVHRHVALQRAGGVQRVEQHARLRGRARAELDELDRARQRRQLGRGLLEDRALGARRVVLGQLADPVEQLGAARVVEVLGRQFLERAREAVEHVLGERAFLAAVEMRVDPDRRSSSAGLRDVGSISSVPRQAHAGEDLPALGQVPVAEREARDAGMRRPRAAAQHAVVLAEEHLRVLAVGVGAEAGVAVRTCCSSTPTPDPSARGSPLLRGRRPLPLGLAGQARVVRSGEGVGLEPGDVAGGRLRRAPAAIRRMVGDVVLLLPGPALVRPPLAPLVAAALAEAHPARVAHRPARDLEGGQLDRVARALVVVGEALRAGAPIAKGPAGSSIHSRSSPPPAAAAADRAWPARRRAAARRSPSSGASSLRAGARGAAPSRRSSRRRAPRARSPRRCARARPPGSRAPRPVRAPRFPRAPRAASRTRRSSSARSGRSSSRPAWRWPSHRSS